MEIKRINNEEELEKAFAIRKEIFVEEQGVGLEDEFDQFDTLESGTVHILMVIDGKPAGTGRVNFFDDYGKLERICIRKDYRKNGCGKGLVQAMEEIVHRFPKRKVILHGQVQAAGFYEKLGYRISSDSFMEEGIAHYVMEKELQ